MPLLESDGTIHDWRGLRQMQKTNDEEVVEEMVVMEMRWVGITPEQYDEVKRRINWLEQPDPDGLVHLAWFEEGALRCCDIWNSEEAFNRFTQNRILPAIEGLGIQGPPEVSFRPAYDTFILERATAG